MRVPVKLGFSCVLVLFLPCLSAYVLLILILEGGHCFCSHFANEKTKALKEALKEPLPAVTQRQSLHLKPARTATGAAPSMPISHPARLPTVQLNFRSQCPPSVLSLDLSWLGVVVRPIQTASHAGPVGVSRACAP